ncbi:sulfate adenylyltransferase [Homoserinimonas sp. OAct 916]|uniref:sulfate adenylyltransferase n=1 Tax=Homoserinimonas sp. OAct 916 TaxID=2211450 RepID=UPI0018E4F749|nr:sulfate adenylyltransferase [Homoserinimonas sp. OAct 916]
MNFRKYPQQPHGGVLVDQVVADGQRDEQIAHARELPSIRIDLEAAITIEMIATGVLSPITGFMNRDDYTSVLESSRLANGIIWPVPLSFAPSGAKNAEIVRGLENGDEVALTDHNGDPVAVLTIQDIFDYDKQHRAQHLFGTVDPSHPGVDSINRRMGDVSLGGPVRLLQRVDWGPFEKLRLEPKDTWRMFYDEKKFGTVAGFITGANPLHRGHEYIHRNALEEIDGLLLQPLVEMAKREYVRHEYRMLAYRNVLDQYYPKDRTVLSPLRVTYIFAGPRETVLHALVMKNYGCTHALIGRDHAGIGDFYDKYASHSIFDEFSPEELGIEVRLFHEVFYCSRCSTHATTRTCPHGEKYRIQISGTGIREMLRQGMLPPKEVVRPESAFTAIQGVQPKGVDEAGQSIAPVAKTISSIFPHYREYERLGGARRPVALEEHELTRRDLEVANRDARVNATAIYAEVYAEHAALSDHNRNMQPAWVDEARQTLRSQQERIVRDLEEKLEQAHAEASDEFLYQDRAETERELSAARTLLAEIPAAADKDALDARRWNALPYKRYRGDDGE